ncbi:MAG: hypothetical protein PHX18_08965 [Candidatus Gastranaerophilales bacterium]|nr:hypothetical protein [Candidatus Gastranaerophilales bacterium]
MNTSFQYDILSKPQTNLKYLQNNLFLHKNISSRESNEILTALFGKIESFDTEKLISLNLLG